jgi:hypothetical protein
MKSKEANLKQSNPNSGCVSFNLEMRENAARIYNLRTNHLSHYLLAYLRRMIGSLQLRSAWPAVLFGVVNSSLG